MANETIDTQTVYDTLVGFGHDYSPEKQAYKYSISTKRCQMYDREGTAVLIPAHDVEQRFRNGELTIENPN